ncbi:cupredoxin domain-containing protein [Microbaculum sp. FT89]|uniref:cupredoxin domain-containing protein n=1 Tax=Microbaculum sp. FT89 TaxID=3447298 RepID=UPI003F53233C
MSLTRRQVLALGGGAVATLALPRPIPASPIGEVEMVGTARGERIWFAPRGLAVAPGTTLRFVNRDSGNSHTATTYHPDLYGRPRRIPAAAEPWDSGFLLPGESFQVTLTIPGVYDYYCIPHEMAAMIGRIVVGGPGAPEWEGPSEDTDDMMPEVRAALPSVDAILSLGRIGEDGSQ